MSSDSKVVKAVERALLAVGLLLLSAFALAHVDRFIMTRAEMARFEAGKFESRTQTNTRIKAVETANHSNELNQDRETDYSLWSLQRIKSHLPTLGKPAEPLGVLRIPRLHLAVPVLEGTDRFTLNRGVGRIAGTSMPGQQGNIGIAGHRDGFFRSLRELQVGDTIELVTTSGTDVYVVDQIRITSPSDVGVLRPRSPPSLTLVTCYPFYFVGPAPNRYVVQASLR